ncbi:hypothetical protein C9F11_10340 [Streptomyces sp. YIM 121038]|uniref:hypothetical protein n=1 Tax=Streptomyces sp. YIM 121038 TaxID=2136401 RepID=UPI0011100F90|nr:hypothetical protein [Streptomyces sp. YIM 121038]QCX75748.1 hypothetical protein C9F11_10340 [Streptomyces sp. YIM 121038]
MPNNEGGWRPPGYDGPGWEPPKEPPQGPPQGPPPGGGRGPGGGSRWSVPGVVAVIVIGVWSVLAYQWTQQNDCELVESYGLVLSHGTPDPWERCGD